MRLFLVLLMLAAPVHAGRRAKDPPNVAEVRLPEEATDFTFGAGDRFSVRVFQHEDLDADLTVAPDGTVTFPLVGRVQVGGRTYAELVAELEQGFQQYYTDASVAVNVLEVNNRKVFVVGEVAHPNVLQITGELTVLEALVRTGGISPDCRSDNLLLIRGDLDDPQLYTVDVDRLLEGELAQNVALQRGDILVVPTRTIVNVERFFRSVDGIIGPFVRGSQIYRNVNLPGGTVIDDESASEGR